MLKNSEKNLLRLVIAISIAAIVFLFWLIYFAPKPEVTPEWSKHLPWVNAVFNSLSACCIVMGLKSIKRRDIVKHQKYMLTAFVFSTLFLISYITYHQMHGDVKFMATGPIRYIYFFILISHILLSIPTLPLVLTTFTLAGIKRWEQHQKVAKITAPLWLYVSISGVLVVVILKFFNT
jgi:putative membrane protein